MAKVAVKVPTVSTPKGGTKIDGRTQNGVGKVFDREANLDVVKNLRAKVSMGSVPNPAAGKSKKGK